MPTMREASQLAERLWPPPGPGAEPYQESVLARSEVAQL